MTATENPAQFGREMDSDGRFVRQPNAFTDVISSDGSTRFPAEPGRYHLYVSLACPWAHRTIIVRELLGLQDVISMSVVDPIRDELGWRFTEGDGHGPDPINGFAYLSEAYLASDPAFAGRWTVPCVWDTIEGRIVTNDYPVITTQMHLAFAEFQTTDADLYPVHLRDAIEKIDQMVFHDINNGVYKAGFATTQEAYEEAYEALFGALDSIDGTLARQRFLVGEHVTEADLRLFTTLVRFDAVYYSHFKCNRQRLSDYRHLWPYARDLYQRPGFHTTTNFDHIKRHYYGTHHTLNPTRIVPKGPNIDWWEPHDRGRL